MNYGVLAGLCVVLLAAGLRQATCATQRRAVLSRGSGSNQIVVCKNELQRYVKLSRMKWPVSQRKYERTLPLALDLVVRGLYSGSGFIQALRESTLVDTGAPGLDIKRVVQEIDLGESLDSALIHWRERAPYQSVIVSVAALTLAAEVGGKQAAAVDSAAAAVRRTLDAAEAAKTNATQSRASAAALVCLPLVISGPLILFNHESRAFMLHTVVGLAFLFVGLGLDLVGWLWMQSMVKRALA